MIIQPQELSLVEAAKKREVTTQAVRLAIKQGRLKASKKNKKWTITLSDLEEFEKNRYNRSFSRVNGKLLFDKEKGLYSPLEASKALGCDRQHVYHALRNKKIVCRKRYKNRWVIHSSDIEAYKQTMRLKDFSR